MNRFVIVAVFVATSLFSIGCDWKSDTEFYQTKGTGRCCEVSGSTSTGSTLPTCNPDETPVCPDSGVGGKQ